MRNKPTSEFGRAMLGFTFSPGTQKFIAPMHAAQLAQSVVGPRPPKIGTRVRLIAGELRNVNVYAAAHQEAPADFNRRVLALGMGRRKLATS
jgi:hypothetical protein